MRSRLLAVVLCSLFGSVACRKPRAGTDAQPLGSPPPPPGTVLTGKAAFGDWTTDRPGIRRRITVADLPEPDAESSVAHGARVVPRPADAQLHVPKGFVVTELASGLEAPRVITVAPNGDLFIVESAAGRVKVLREGKTSVYLEGLTQPFGLAFHPPGPAPTSVYIANTDSVVRLPYAGEVVASAKPTTIVPNIPGGGKLRGGGHWTRDLAFSNDGKRMFVSVGSMSNAGDSPSEERRACILAFDADGGNETTYAAGIRNAVGLAVHPITGELWASVNERDELGDHLVPDYVTHVVEGGHYGWPWFYLGAHQDPRHPGKRKDLAAKVLVPDVLLQSHSASLDMTFYTGTSFPAEYKNDAFAAEHGSWNRSRRTGYKVVRIPLKDGRATGEYEDFLTGFVLDEERVWGRPVGVAVAKDGALLVSDDGGGRVFRIAYDG